MAEFQPIIPADNTQVTVPESTVIPALTNTGASTDRGASIDTDLSRRLASYVMADQTKYVQPVSFNEKDAQRYDQYNAYLDNEEIAAKNQGFWGALGNSLAKGAATTVGTFAQGLMSTYDLIQLGQGNSAYKNEFSQSIDDWRDNLENTFPNYYSHYEQEHPFLGAVNVFNPHGFANFWGDQFLKNIGFTIGAIGSAVIQDAAIGAVTQGIGEIPLIGNQIGKAALYLNKLFSGTNKLDELLNTATTLGKSEAAIANMARLTELSAAQKVGSTARYLTTLTGAANAEAGIEARDGYNTVKQDLTDQFVREHGYQPFGEDADKIESYATSSGNFRYGINMALLTVSDAIQFEHILKPWNSFKSDFAKGIEAETERQLGRVGVAAEKVTAANQLDEVKLITDDIVDKGFIRNKAAAIWNKVQPILPNILAEGIYEEGGQFATQKATEKYWEDKYTGKNKGTVDDAMKATIYGLGQQFGTTEGLENMFIGGLTGALMGPVENYVTRRQAQRAGVLTPEQATVSAIDNLNKQGVTGLFQNNFDNTAQTVKNGESLKEAIESNDVFKFQNLKSDSFFNFVNSGLQNGRYGVRIEQLKMLKELPNEELNKLFGIPEGTSRDNHAYINNLIAKAEDIKRSYDAISNLIANPYTHRGNISAIKDPKKQENAIRENDAWQGFEDYKTALSKFSYQAQDFNSRSTALAQEIQQIHPLLTQNLAQTLNDPRELRNLSNQYKQEAIELDKSLEGNLLKGQDRKDIQAKRDELRTLAEHTDQFLRGTYAVSKDGYDHMKLVGELANFEINAKNPNGTQVIDKTKLPDLIIKGNDLNKLNFAKKQASAAYDHLLSEDGLESFLQNRDKWLESLSLPIEEKIKEEVIKVGEQELEKGRNYTTKDLNFTAVKNGEVYDLKNPWGEVVDKFATREEAESRRDEENSNIKDKLNKVKVLGKEGNKLRVEDSTGKVQLIDPRFLERAEKKLTEEEIVKNRKELNKKFYDLQKAEAKNEPDFNAGDTTQIDSTEWEEPKKRFDILFNSTTYNYSDPKEYTKRQQYFFTNFNRLPQAQKARLRTILITKNNEGFAGLKGLVDYSMSGNTKQGENIKLYDINDPQETPILTVFVEQDENNPKTLHFIDAEGNRIGKVGEQVNENQLANNIIFGTLPIPKLFYESEGVQGQPVYRKGEDKLAAKEAEQYKKRRVELVKLKDSFPVFKYAVSRGVPIEDKDANGILQKHSVTSTLIPKVDENGNDTLFQEGLVVVSTGEIATPTGSFKLQAGKPVLSYGSTIEVLRNRVLNEKEAITIFSLLKVDSEQGQISKETLNFLKSILYYRTTDKTTGGSNQIFVDKEGTLHIGHAEYPFSYHSLADSELEILEDLQKLYINTNNKLLKTNDPFTEIIGFDLQNNLKKIQWKSYQHYLLSDTYDIEDNPHIKKGTKRSEEEIPLTTSVRQQQGVNDANYKGKYAILQKDEEGNTLYTQPKQKEKKVETKQEQKETKTTKEGLSTIETKYGTISYKIENGEVKIADERDLGTMIVSYMELEKKSDSEATEAVLKILQREIAKQQEKATESTSVVAEEKIEKEAEKIIANKSNESELLKELNKYLSGKTVLIGNLINRAPFNYKVISVTLKTKKGFSIPTLHILANRINVVGKEETLSETLELSEINRSSPEGQEIKSIIDKYEKPIDLAETRTEVKQKPKAKKGSGNFRLSTEWSSKMPQNIEKEKAWFEANIPIPVERIQNIIQTTSGGFAVGQLINGMAQVWDGAQTGTYAHEGFHAIWQMYTNLKEKKAIIKEFNNRTGSYRDYITGALVDYSKANESQIEEQLAEELGEYVATGVMSYKEKKSAIAKFFSDIWNFIKNFITGTQSIEQLFKKINSGYYKTAPQVGSSSNNPSYKSVTIGNLSVAQSYALVRDMSREVVTSLLRDNKSLNELDNIVDVKQIFAYIKDTYQEFYTDNEVSGSIPDKLENGEITKEQYEKYQLLWNELNANWNQAEALTKEYLKTFGVVVKQSKNKNQDHTADANKEDLDKQDENSGYEGGNNADSYTQDAFSIDSKRTAPASIKLLIATTAEVADIDQEGNLVSKLDAQTGTEVMVNYSKVFSFLLNNLSGYNTLQEKTAKLKEIAQLNPTYRRIINRLKLNDENITEEDALLQAKFFGVFSKQNPEALVQIVNTKDNRSTIVSLNSNIGAQQLVQSWLDAMKYNATQKDNIVQVENGQYKWKGNLIKGDVSTPEGVVKFLNTLSVPFSVDMYEALSDSDKTKLNKNVKELQKELIKKTTFDITASGLDSAGNFNIIATIYQKVTQDADSTFFNIEGERMQNFVQTNFISQAVNDITNAKNTEDLYQRLPQLQNEYSQDSVYLNSALFSDGRKTGKVLTIGYTQGIVKDSVGNPISKFNYPTRVFAEINQNLVGNYYILVPADSKTEWILKMQQIIPYKDISNADANDRIYNILNNYYHTERNIAAVKGKGYKSLMSEINGDYESEDLDRQKFKDFFNQRIRGTIEFLKKEGIITEKDGTYRIKDLNTDFKSSNEIKDKLSEKDLFDLFKFREVNYVINNIELHKLFFGDIAAIKDPTKRYKSFLSPREMSMYGDQQFNNTLNAEKNKVGDVSLQEGDYGYWKFKDFMNTATMADVLSYTPSIVDDEYIDKDIREAYKANNGTDAQSWAFLPAYREVLLKSSGRWSNEHETLYNLLMAQDRQAMLADGHLTDETYRKELQKKDEELIKTGYNGHDYFPILKPIGSGFTTESNAFLDKTSLAPLSYTSVRGTNMESHYLKMWKQGLSYLIVDSGRKIGNTGANEFYNENGTVNDNQLENIVQIPFRYYGIQVETAGSKKRTTIGTQLTTMAMFNLRNGGVPVDFSGSTKEWKALDEKQKEERSLLYKKITRNVNALKELQSVGYQELLDKLGLEERTGEFGERTFSAPDKQKVLTLLQDELFRREAPQNLKDALSLNEQGEFTIPFEAVNNYRQIKNILFAYVDKLIAKPKFNGGAKIQSSGALIGKGVREVKVVKIKGTNKNVFVSNGLKFYEAIRDKDGKVTSVARMEVLLPMWFRDKLKKSKQWKNATNEEILEHIQKNSSELLNGIGFRIPTQEINSVEAFTVKGFAPDWTGSNIVVPEAITTKAGSDFDVDKLNSYLKNVYIDKDGNIKAVPFYGYGEAAKDKIAKEVFAKILGEKVRPDENAIDNLDLEADDTEDVENTVDSLYKQSLENEYFSSLEDLILTPEAFDRLIKPNSAQDLINIKNHLAELSPSEFGTSKTNVLNSMAMSNLRHQFIVGKGGVGIAASNQKANSIAQSSEVVLDFSRFKFLSKVKKDIFNDKILFPFNKIDNKLTVSGVTDNKGNLISNNTSMLIDGFVDIAKDPWISVLIYHPSLVGTATSFIRMGLNPKTTFLLMNQPIVRDYMNLIGKGDRVDFFNKKNIDKTKALYKANEANISLPSDAELSEMIRKYYNGEKLTQEENNKQQVLLNQFLIGAILSQELFKLQQGISYDNDSAADPFLWIRKVNRTYNAVEKNLFIGAENLLNRTHLANLMNKEGSSIDAISNTFTIINNNSNMNILNQVVSQLPFGLDRNAYTKAIRSIEESYISYLIQTNGNLNIELGTLLVNTTTSVAKRINELKSSLNGQYADSDLANNLVLKDLITLVKENTDSAKNVTTAHKVFDSYTIDAYTQSMRELRDNPLTRDLYKDLVKLSFLQSGIGSSALSYSKFIPIENYAAIVKPILDNLDTAQNREAFVTNGMFFRNQWKNKQLVPNHFLDNEARDLEFSKVEDAEFLAFKQANGIKDNKFKLYNTTNHQLKNSNYITISFNSGNKVVTLLLRKVYTLDGMPYQVHNMNTFIPINPLGDGINAQEYYNSPQKSIITTNAYTPPIEMSNFDILTALYTKPEGIEGEILDQDETIEEQPTQSTSNITFEEEPTTGYRNRTIKNASADATIAIAVDFNSAGERLTKSSVLGQRKKYIALDFNNTEITQERVDKIVEQLNSVNAKSLNIAGNGIYTMKGKFTQEQVDNFTYNLLKRVIESPNLKNKIEFLRTGGQTGFDEAGAKAGFKLGIPTLILAPKGYTFRDINGKDISNEKQFKSRFGDNVEAKPLQGNLFDESNIAPEGKPSIDITKENNCP